MATTITTTGQQQEIPCPSEWPHRPVFIKASEETKLIGLDANKPLPLGVPVEFETPHFKGRILVRLRNSKTDDRDKHDAYFAGRDRVTQHVIQGQFKRPMNMADVLIGTIFNKPMRLVPPSFIAKLLKLMLDRIGPGSTMDLTSERPAVLALYGGSAQTISIDLPGQEPDISAPNLVENVQRTFGRKFKSSKHRRKALSTPKVAKQYQYDTEHVYTFHAYDQSIDYGTYNIKLPVIGHFALSNAIGAQPMKISAANNSGQELFSFEVHHESIYNMAKSECKKACATQL